MELSALRQTLGGFARRVADSLVGQTPAQGAARDPVEVKFLPDFCAAHVVINVAIIAEMLAIVITLVTRRISLSLFQDLLLISLFVQWIALTSVAVLCQARPWLNRLPRTRSLLMSYALLLLVTLAVSEAALWLLWGMGQLSTARPEWYAYFHIQNFTVSAVVNALALRYLVNKHELTQRTLSEARARIQALQSRIRPHFVFNALNIIASLTRNEPARAERAVEDMADLFRMMLSEDEMLVPVKKEVDVARKYVALETLRLDQRLHVDWEVGTFPRKAAMPVLTLQPLLEYAIHHGIEPWPSGGTVGVRLWEDNDKIHIQVVNPCPPTKSKSAAAESRTLENLRSRLQSHYGDAAVLDAGEENGVFRVTVVLPTRGGNL
ncbi:histidine kinase [Sulfurifustis variabilis]|uniref:Histidine kinase n=1 Tax=Sulfurifustis variabilis TaxID=1675686 RepID=A0A1B4V0U3_9GAMM|nr:histidine kinase [Sulfurifustis variabilis]BAU47086.1 histidine kinase [Sulfurifustis variabilis]